jgi:ecotin
MKKGERMKGSGLLAALGLLLLGSSGQAADDMKAFPPADPGMSRHVLHLPEQADEDAFKVELIVGKTVETDQHNRYFFGGGLREEVIVGWGYTRYVLSELGPMAGTLMAVDPDAPKVARFITVGGGPYLVRYNSRLPVVVYVPEGVEVRYRLWSASSTAEVIEPG